MSELYDDAFRSRKRRKIDYDPEDEPANSSSNDDEGDNVPSKSSGREHYQSVDRSTLRSRIASSPDPKYDGMPISRTNLQDHSEDDPFAPVDEDEDEDPFAIRKAYDSEDSQTGDELEAEDDAREQDGVQNVADARMRSKANTQSPHTEDSTQRQRRMQIHDHKRPESDDISSERDDDEDVYSSDPDVESANETDGTESLTSAEALESPPKSASGSMTDREKLKALQAGDASVVAESLTAAAAAEADKGQAIKQQRNTYDLLLDSRIKLQKALNCINEAQNSDEMNESVLEDIETAETAVLSLLSTTDRIRREVIDATTGAGSTSSIHGKNTAWKPETSLTEIWSHMQSSEQAVEPHRRSVLDHWSARSRAQMATNTRSQLAQGTDAKLSAVLDAFLATESPKVVSQSVNANEASSGINYNDDVFYQALLRDLIASRAQLPSSDMQPVLPSKLHQSRSSKKNVDTKASKGRKIRYTIHEKLQNFMAPEDRSTWTDSASREFFASLFGQRNMLHENAEDETEKLNGSGEEEALRLFRQ